MHVKARRFYAAKKFDALCAARSLACRANFWYNLRMTNLELMRICENTDEDAFEQDDFPERRRKSDKDVYDEFYDDVKQPSRYIKEDW